MRSDMKALPPQHQELHPSHHFCIATQNVVENRCTCLLPPSNQKMRTFARCCASSVPKKRLDLLYIKDREFLESVSCAREV
jgi:hypothetical protein